MATKKLGRRSETLQQNERVVMTLAPSKDIEKLITVLIPAYNAERFLEETLRSVSSQTHKNLEIIVVDDGSVDGTSELLTRYAETESRLIAVRQSNRGISSALNTGLRLASGSLVARIDADDLMTADRLAKQAAFLEENQTLGFCASAIEMINDSGRKVGEFTLAIHTLGDLEYMLRQRRQFSFTHPTVMYRKAAVKAVGGYHREYEPCEDLHLFLRMHNAGFPGVAMCEKLTKYRLHMGSISGSQTKRQVRMRDFIFYNFYQEIDGREAVDFATFRRRGSALTRSYAWWREQADVLHSKARYKRALGSRVGGTALLIVAVAMKAERFPPRAIGSFIRKFSHCKVSVHGDRGTCLGED